MQINIHNLNQMINGWFVGDFENSALRTKDFEVAVKFYKAGDMEGRHVHQIATEITVILHGQVKMCGQVLQHGDIITLKPGESTAFEAITDVTTVVVKTPSVIGDKYVL